MKDAIAYKRKFDVYRMKKKFLSEKEKVELYERYLAIDRFTQKEFIFEEYNNQLWTTSKDGINGNAPIEEVLHFFSCYSNGRDTFNYLFSEMDTSYGDDLVRGRMLLSASDWMNESKKTEELDLAQWTKEGVLTINLNQHEIDFYVQQKKEIRKCEMRLIEDSWDIQEKFLGDSWDFYPPVNLFPESKELQELSKIYAIEDFEEREKSIEKRQEKIMSSWRKRIRKFRKLYINIEDNNFYDQDFKEVKLKEIFH